MASLLPSSRVRVRTALSLGALGGASAAGCSYDFDKLYAHEPPPLENLIELWSRAELSDECVACASDKCADVEAACRGDAQCAEFTACVAEDTNPAQLYACRERFRDWLLTPDTLLERDMGGPFAQCVFQQLCDLECGSRTNLQCVDEFAWPTTSRRSLPFRLRLSDTRGDAVVGARVKVCAPEQTESCSSDEEVVSDGDGIVDLTLPVSSTGAFLGYLEVTGAEIYNSLVRFGWPMANGGVTNLTLIPQAVYIALAAESPVALSDERGLLQLRAFGCSSITTEGVSFSLAESSRDDTTLAWYTRAGEIFPSFDAEATDKLGAGGIINVPTGPVSVHAERAADGIDIADITAPVRAGFLTIVLVAPVRS